jgi:hypothetical protein
VNKVDLIGYFERIDKALHAPVTLCVYGSAAFMLLDEPDRTSLDVDVAAPYSCGDLADLRQAAASAGLPINPDADLSADHLEWISAARLCLPRPAPETETPLWQGRKLAVKTVSAPQLVASKLIRYDEIDRSDIQYLWRQAKLGIEAVAAAVAQLPSPFDRDPLVLDNLANLKTDIGMWSREQA